MRRSVIASLFYFGRQISLDFPGSGADEISIASSQRAASPSDASTRPLSVDECDTQSVLLSKVTAPRIRRLG
jgi:hypothetical protein